jgi:uncharacterized membrane protein YfcA
MALSVMLSVWLLTVATAMLSGVFGMAGGMVLIGVLLVLLPLPEAMALHAVTQMASNLWRAAFLLKHIRWRIAAGFAAGCLLAMAVWSLILFVPPKPLALIALGLSPFALSLLPARMKPDPERPRDGLLCGAASMSLMLLAGVSGPLVDRFFLGGKLDRRGIVATKAAVQVVGHALKLVYFGGLVASVDVLDPVAAGGAILATLAGTALAQPLLNALTETAYRRWANRIVTTIAIIYVTHGTALLFWPG